MRLTCRATPTRIAKIAIVRIARPYLVALAFIALGASIIWQELRFWPFYIDDSYISLVYAKNWISGNGLTYNGKVVEGYSNFLWVILLGVMGWPSVDLELASRLLGMFFSLLALPLLDALGRQLCGRRLAGWLAGALLAVSGPFLAWAVGGLETSLYLVLLLLTLRLVLKERDRRAPPLSALAALLLSLTRPEGAGLVAVVALYLALMALLGVVSRRYVVGWVAIFALGFGAFLAWRYLYYHDWLPAPVLAKRGSLSVQIAVAQSRLKPLLAAWWAGAAGAVLGFLLLLTLPTARRGSALLLALVALADAAFIMLSGSDWMPMHRFVVPILPLLFLGLAGGLCALADWLTVRGRAAWIGWALPVLLVLPPLLQIADWTERNRGQAIEYGVASSAGVKQLALRLLREAPPGASLAVIDAGALPYYTGLPTLDLIGLNDQYIARSGSFGTYLDSSYVLAAKPTYIVLHSLRSSSGQPIFIDFLPSARLYYDIEFQRWYEPDYRLPMHPFVRRRTPREHTIMDAFYKATYHAVKVWHAAPGQRAQVEVIIHNQGTGVWVGADQLLPGAVYAVCRLRDPATGSVVAEQWAALGHDLAPGDRRLIRVPLSMPEQAGDYVLEIDMVLNEVARFSEQGNPVAAIRFDL
jgi:hypothetical protein